VDSIDLQGQPDSAVLTLRSERFPPSTCDSIYVLGQTEDHMDTNGEIVKALYDAFGRGDVAAVLGAFDPEIQWREAESFLYADGNPYVGPQAVAEGVFQRLVSAVGNFAVLPERFIEGSDTVVAEGRYQGTMKATGTAVDAQFAHIWQLRDGKVVRFQQYTDTRQWSEAARS
jgi:ketosteroid isomerase-like protein